MNSPENIHITVVNEETKGNDRAVAEGAIAHARTLLSSWRSRFTDAETISKEYSTTEGAHIVVHSPSAEKVHLEYATAEGQRTTYDFDAATESLTVETTIDGQTPDSNNLLAYDTFSRALFDCDKLELLG